MRGDGDSGLVEPMTYGRIAMVDRAAGRCVVAAGDIVTQPVRWLERRAGATRSWSPPSVGEQGVLVCPGGDPAGAFFIPGVFSDAHPAIADQDRELVRFGDGTVVAYDAAAHRLQILLAAGGPIEVEAEGGIAIKAAGGMTIDGSLSIDGNLEVATGASGSFTTHTGLVVTVVAGIVTDIA